MKFTYFSLKMLFRVPVRILHAELDQVIPIQQSESLVEDAKQSGKMNIDLVRYHGNTDQRLKLFYILQALASHLINLIDLITNEIARNTICSGLSKPIMVHM